MSSVAHPRSLGAGTQAKAKPAPPRPPDLLRAAARISPVVGLLLCAGAVIAGMSTGVLGSASSLQAFIGSLGAWGPLVFLLASLASTVFPIVPGGLLVIAAPILFGPLEGSIYSYLSVCAGSMLNFLIARRLGLGAARRIFSEAAIEKHLAWTRHPRFSRAFALAIALPVAPDDLLCYLAGTTRMRFSTFATIILLGKPWTILAYGLGASALLTTVLPW